jgi:hypothetical protein
MAPPPKPLRSDMKIYKSPVYPALMIHVPVADGGRRPVKASGGYFNVPDDLTDGFEAVVAERPQYRIEYVGTGAEPESDATQPTDAEGSENGIVVQPEPVSESEKNPEMATVETLEQLNVGQLKERLEGLGLPTDGRKAVLVKRLADATNTSTGLGDDESSDADDADAGDDE